MTKKDYATLLTGREYNNIITKTEQESAANVCIGIIFAMEDLR